MFRAPIVFVLYLLCVAASVAQNIELTPEKLGYDVHSFSNDALGEVNYYVSKPEAGADKPMLIYLDGSGPYPLYQRMTRGYGSTVLVDSEAVKSKYNLALISKPGVPFVDDLGMDPATGVPIYDPPAEYEQRLSLGWRVDAAKQVIDELLGKHKYTPQKIVVLGISEGFQVGAKLAAIEPRITHVGLFVGNGLSQFYDFMIFSRTKAERGELTPTEAQKEVDEILKAANDIYAHPESVDKHWMGHTYKRWASFSRSAPLEHLLNVRCPIFTACCTLDKNTSIISADYIPLEFAKRGKQNLTYRTYPYEHSFMEPIRDADGQVTGARSHMDEAVEDFLKWVDAN
jgi:pimeloyl-ACP methyl ester carboxylesterase